MNKRLLLAALDETPGLQTIERFILVCYAVWANEAGEAWPGIKKVAARAGVGPRYTQMARSRLRDMGYLLPLPGPGNAPQRMRVCIPPLDLEAGFTPPETGFTPGPNGGSGMEEEGSGGSTNATGVAGARKVIEERREERSVNTSSPNNKGGTKAPLQPCQQAGCNLMWHGPFCRDHDPRRKRR